MAGALSPRFTGRRLQGAESLEGSGKAKEAKSRSKRESLGAQATVIGKLEVTV
jgi:hypothetical protein